jgi:hypothetical protein
MRKQGRSTPGENSSSTTGGVIRFSEQKKPGNKRSAAHTIAVRVPGTARYSAEAELSATQLPKKRVASR